MNINDTIEWYQNGMVANGIIKEIHEDYVLAQLTIDVGILYSGSWVSVPLQNIID